MAKKSKKKLTTKASKRRPVDTSSDYLALANGIMHGPSGKPKKKPVEPKPFHEVAEAVDAYAVSSLMEDLGPALWDLLDLFKSQVFVVSPGTDDEARIRPLSDKLMLECHTNNGKDHWRLVEWGEVKDELARPE